MKFNEELIEKIEKFISIKNRGYYCSGTEVTKVYNEVFESNIRPSNCSSCIINRIKQLEDALKRYRSEQEALKSNDLDNTPSTTKEAIVEANAGENKPPEKKVGRPRKQ